MFRIPTLAAASCLAVSLLSSAAGPVQVVSRPYTNLPHAFGDSSGGIISADGRWVLFNSNGSGLTTNAHNALKLDVFLRDLNTGTTTLVSRSTRGSGANGDSLVSDLSADGRFVVFESDAPDLLEGDENDSSDVFLWDRETGDLTVLSKSGDTTGDGASGAASITRDGRFVLFESSATNLVPQDSNDALDLFLYDRTSSAIRAVTIRRDNSGTASGPFVSPAGGTMYATVSEDGRYVAFLSGATNLVNLTVPTTAGDQLYLRDMNAGTNLWVSQTATHVAGKNISAPVMSTNGAVLAFGAESLAVATRWVYLYSVASNSIVPIPNPTGSIALSIDEFALSADGKVLAFILQGQVYRYDIGGGTVEQVTTAETASAAAGNPVLSDDGSILVFSSAATNLTQVPANSQFQLFSYNAAKKSIVLLTPNWSGTMFANADALFPSLSADGAKVSFMSYASDLVTNDDKNQNDVFVAGTSGSEPVQLVSAPSPEAFSATAAGSSDLKVRAMSADGRFVAFNSFAYDLVASDNNSDTGVFLADLQTGTNRLVSVGPDGIQPLPGSSTFLALSTNGRWVAFRGNNGSISGISQSIYIYDAQAGSNFVGSILPDGTVASAVDGNLSLDGRYLAFRTNAAVGSMFVRDLQAGETRQILNGVNPSGFVGISPGGNYFLSFANGGTLRLADWRSNRTVDVFAASSFVVSSADDSTLLIYSNSPGSRVGSDLKLYATASNTYRLIATNASYATLSRDGSVVAYIQRDLSNTVAQVFTYEVASGRASEVPLPNLPSSFRFRTDPVLSDNGRYLAFVSTNDLIPGLTPNGFGNVFVYDRVLLKLSLASHTPTGGYPEFGSSDVSLSADGQTVVFQSNASDLVANDRNSVSDVFVTRIDAATPLDGDHDGLPDAWELAHFGNLSAGAGDDTDGDGAMNLQEFRTGTDPSDRTSVFRVNAVSMGTGQETTVTWSAVPGKSYQLQSRSDLDSGNWQNVGAPMVAASDTAAVTTTSSGESGFYRVGVVE